MPTEPKKEEKLRVKTLKKSFKLHPAGTKTSLNSFGMIEICLGYNIIEGTISEQCIFMHFRFS